MGRKSLSNRSSTSSRVYWADLLRGLCMLAILWFHTEVYYIGHEQTPYILYVADALAVFFFLSGYFFYRRWGFEPRQKLRSLWRHLVVPYFMFMLCFALPKSLAHHKDLDFVEMLQPILMGEASWFITALVMAQLLFIFFLWITREKMLPLTILTLLSVVAAACFSNADHSIIAFNKFNFWHINEALLAVFFLFLGYTCHRYPVVFRQLSHLYYLLPLLLLWIALKYYVWNSGFQMLFGPLNATPLLLFILILTMSTLLFCAISQYLPSCAPVEWVGRHSLVYYFFCGGVPFMVSQVMIRNGITYQPLTLLIAFLAVVIITTVITRYIYRTRLL